MLQWSRLHTTAWNKLYRKKKSHDPSSVQGSDSNNNKKEYAVWKSSKHYKTLLPADTQHPIGHLSTAPGTNSSANKKLDSRSDTERERTTVHATLSTHFIFFLLFHFFSLLNTCFFFFGTHFKILYNRRKAELKKKPCSLTRLSYCRFRDCFRDYMSEWRLMNDLRKKSQYP